MERFILFSVVAESLVLGYSEPLLSVSATGDWWSYRVQFHTLKSWPWCSYTWLYLVQERKATCNNSAKYRSRDNVTVDS